MTIQGSVKVSTHGGADSSFLLQQLYGRLSLADSLWMAARVHLAVILSVDEALHNLVTFAFAASHLFSAGRRHPYAVTELLCLIGRLEELHIELQRTISPPHLATSLLYNVLQCWIQYLKRCVAASASEVVEAPGSRFPFSL